MRHRWRDKAIQKNPIKSLCALFPNYTIQTCIAVLWLAYLRYIEDGFVTIGAFLEKIKEDFRKICKSDIHVVQGENIPSSLSSQCVLCIHNLAPVKKVDPTWAVRPTFAVLFFLT